MIGIQKFYPRRRQKVPEKLSIKDQNSIFGQSSIPSFSGLRKPNRFTRKKLVV